MVLAGRIILIFIAAFLGLTFADDFFRLTQIDDLPATADEKEYIKRTTPLAFFIQLSELALITVGAVAFGFPVSDSPLAFIAGFVVVAAYRYNPEWREKQDIDAMIKIRARMKREESKSKNDLSE